MSREFRPASEGISQNTVQLAREVVVGATDRLPYRSFEYGQVDPHLQALGVEVEDRVTLNVRGQEVLLQRGVTKPQGITVRPGLLLSMVGSGAILRGQSEDMRWRFSVDGDTGELIEAVKGTSDKPEFDTALIETELQEIALTVRQAAIEAE